MDKDIQEVVIKVTKDYSDKLVHQTGVEPTVTVSDMKDTWMKYCKKLLLTNIDNQSDAFTKKLIKIRRDTLWWR